MNSHPRFALLSLALLSPAAAADVVLPSVFQDHMVLQRQKAIPVWGLADPGEQVRVEFGPQLARATADSAGRWRVDLKPCRASADPLTLTVQGQNRVEIVDVLVGEVWLCTGQSNMEWVVANSKDAEQEIARGDHPRIRHFKAAHSLSHEPEFTVTGKWAVCSPATVGAFSAVGYYFGLDLLEHLDVPIGLISTNWGGTRAEPWTAPDALASHPDYAEAMAAQRDALETIRSTPASELEARYRADLAAARHAQVAYWDAVTAEDPGMSAGWRLNDFEAEDWPSMQLPAIWETADERLAQQDGLVWFRHRLEIPKAWAAKPLRLELGMIDDSDLTFFNGVRVGTLISQHTGKRSYMVPGELVDAGQALITVLVYDTGGAGGFGGPAEEMRLTPIDKDVGESLSLAGEWNWKVGGPPQAATRPAPVRHPGQLHIDSRTPGAMFNAMIHPFLPYGIRGAIWYQGESNAGQPAAYRELLPLMIASWRGAFGQGAFPFGIVQLASFHDPALDLPVEGGWAELRDAQLHTLHQVPNTGLVVASDIGEAKDIHPRNKQEVGRRLALWALAMNYGVEDLEYSGPLFRSMKVHGEELHLSFDHAEGLTTRDGKAPAGFAIGDEGGRFQWADARIEGETVILSAKGLSKPTAARMGWCNNLEHLNLVNGADLPASPFRSDGPQ